MPSPWQTDAVRSWNVTGQAAKVQDGCFDQSRLSIGAVSGGDRRKYHQVARSRKEVGNLTSTEGVRQLQSVSSKNDNWSVRAAMYAFESP